MSHRYLAYPLLVLAMFHLAPLWRRDRDWNQPMIARLLVVAILGVVAFAWPHGAWCVALGWAVFLVMVVGPQLALMASYRDRQQHRYERAARWEQLAAALLGGRWGRLRRELAKVLRDLARGDDEAALTRLRGLQNQSMPVAARGVVRFWELRLLLHRRDWLGALWLFEETSDWGSARIATEARLQVARAFAELGDVPRALRCLQFVVLSPSVVRLEQPLWAMRVRLAAMAGDEEELVRLLAKPPRGMGGARWEAYWRGRCALTRGERTEARRWLSRAMALTDLRDAGWRQAIQFYLSRAEPAVSSSHTEPVVCAASLPAYQAERAALQRAEEWSRPWRELMGWTQPTPVVVGLWGGIAGVFAAQLLLPYAEAERLIVWGGNGAVTIQQGEWWRLITAMFLHGGWFHWAFNSVALWFFGSAIERRWGGTRVLVIFFGAGAAGNLLSAMSQRPDLAIGASAGIFGLLGAFSVAIAELKAPAYATLRASLLRVLFALVAVDLLVGWLEPLVDNLAHLGGFVAGVLIAWLTRPRTAAPAQT
ncbi:MAG: rhomboid family intramembrane serine protease [Verrucomicrobiae bacterium]|nr:rhomboid family intramembrane serine protease [Verrucomicrobiae bacterium]MDW8345187.1 rhomboid family intramembrane serine protease [Verrucomicrobiae bacterium]